MTDDTQWRLEYTVVIPAVGDRMVSGAKIIDKVWPDVVVACYRVNNEGERVLLGKRSYFAGDSRVWVKP